MTIRNVKGYIALAIDVDTVGEGLVYRGALAAAVEDGDDRFRLVGFHLMLGGRPIYVRGML